MAGKVDNTTNEVLEETEYKRQGSIDDENFLYLNNSINNSLKDIEIIIKEENDKIESELKNVDSELKNVDSHIVAIENVLSSLNEFIQQITESFQEDGDFYNLIKEMIPNE